MAGATKFYIALVTAPDRKTARKLARCALEARVAACANLVSAIESHYWWQGRIETSAEVLIIFKTTKKLRAALEKVVLENHPYDTPEFIVLPIEAGNPRYLEWLAVSVGKAND